MQTWDSQLPIYQQLADLLATRLLEGDPPEGEPMPSVRTLAGQFLLNPRGDGGLVETRRGLGHYVRSGARARLREAERARFLDIEWPRLRQRLARLGLTAADLDWEDR